MSALLAVEGLAMRFGGLLAIADFSCNIAAGQAQAIIGPNGAGKTTVLNCISGFYRPHGGSIRYRGDAITGLPTHRIARLGVVRTFQNIRLFRNMTVLENLLIAQHHQYNTGLLAGLFRSADYRRRDGAALQRAGHWLQRMDLLQQANRPAGFLPYGQQRRLEIARCLITEPQLLLLDEPAAGLNPSETLALVDLLRELIDELGISILLIEHDMAMVMRLAEHILVMDQGRLLVQGPPSEIRRHPDVIRVYLGEQG